MKRADNASMMAALEKDHHPTATMQTMTNAEHPVKDQQPGIASQPVSTVSHTSSNFPKIPSRILLRDTPPIDLERCRPQLQREGIAIPPDWPVPVQPDCSLDASQEECFTLDSFDKLVRQARGAGRDFILARVMTVDAADASKVYWSFYAAHHINKVLFRTQPEQMLLHRMRCRNPLNNMVIIGEVHYFAIGPEAVDKAHLRAGIDGACDGSRHHAGRNGDSRNIVGDNAINAPIIANNNMPLSASSVKAFHLPTRSLSISSALPPTLELPQKIPRTRSSDNILNSPVLQPNIEHSHCAVTPNTQAIEYEARYIGSDEDFLQRQNFREYFISNAVTPADAELFPLNGNAYQAPHSAPPRSSTALRTARGSTHASDGALMYWPPRRSCLLDQGGVMPWPVWLLSMLLSVAGVFLVCFLCFEGPLVYIGPAVTFAVMCVLGALFIGIEESDQRPRRTSEVIDRGVRI